MCVSQPSDQDKLKVSPVEQDKPSALPEKSPLTISVEERITPQEMRIVKYHRESIETGNVGRDEEGRPVTVYSNTIQIQEGKNKGKFVTVPGWFDGKRHGDEDKIYSRWKDEIDKGLWPVYSSPKDADSRAKFIHQVMDEEGDGRTP